MSQTLDKIGPAPETRFLSFLLLLFGACAAPLFWLGQMMLGYGITAYACYPGDHPAQIASSGALGMAMMAFDGIALAAAAAGSGVSWWCWRHVQREKRDAVDFRIGEGRMRFLALWGIFSSLWFLCAIIFNIIASVTVPPCLT